MKISSQKGLYRLEKWYDCLEKAAKTALHSGLVTVLVAALIQLFLSFDAESAAQVRMLTESLGALAACLPIVFGGAFAVDAVLKGK